MAYIIAALITILLDQATKIAVLANFRLYESKAVLGKVLYLTHITNKGGAFGLLSNFPAFFIFLAVIMVVCGIAFIPRIWKLSGILKISLGLLIGGTIGNLIDRIRFGYVVDFIDFKVWPAFNVADIAICVGVILIAIQLLTFRESKHTEDDAAVAGATSRDSEAARKQGMV